MEINQCVVKYCREVEISKYEVRGKKVLITGAASGIGREFSSLFAADGADLVLDHLPAKKESWLSGQGNSPINTKSIPGSASRNRIFGKPVFKRRFYAK